MPYTDIDIITFPAATDGFSAVGETSTYQLKSYDNTFENRAAK